MIDTTYLEKSLETLKRFYTAFKTTKPEDSDYDIFRTSLVQAFEFTLEECGKLLKKRLFEFFGSKQKLDTLTFKDRFREAYKCGLLKKEEVERWEHYRDTRNQTAHDYHEENAEEVLACMNTFLTDVEALIKVIHGE